jgi:hypothetical protein
MTDIWVDDVLLRRVNHVARALRRRPPSTNPRSVSIALDRLFRQLTAHEGREQLGHQALGLDSMVWTRRAPPSFLVIWKSTTTSIILVRIADGEPFVGVPRFDLAVHRPVRPPSR